MPSKKTIDVLKIGIQGTDIYPVDKTLDYLTEISKQEGKTGLCLFTRKEKREFYKILHQIKHRNVDHIIDMIEEAKEV